MWEMKYIHKNEEKFWVNGKKKSQLNYNYLHFIGFKDSSSNMVSWISFQAISTPTQVSNTQPFHQIIKQFYTLLS